MPVIMSLSGFPMGKHQLDETIYSISLYFYTTALMQRMKCENWLVPQETES